MVKEKKEQRVQVGGAWVTKKMQLRTIGVTSTFRVFFGMTLVLSLIFMSLFQLFGFEIAAMLAQGVFAIQGWVNSLQLSFPQLFSNPILYSLLLSLAYGIVTGLWIAISVGLFTLFSLLLGGIDISVRERSSGPTRKFL